MPYIGRSTDGFGVRNRFLYLASADDTSVSGADANGATLTFTDGAYVDVYLNGVLLKAGTDYNTNTANTIASLAAMAANDEVTVVVYDVFTVGDMVSATSGGTFVGNVNFGGDIDVDGTTNLDVVDIDGALTQDGGAVFNEASADVDFRVESNGNTHMLFVDGGNDGVGIGTSSVDTASTLTVSNTSDAHGITIVGALNKSRMQFQGANTGSASTDGLIIGLSSSDDTNDDSALIGLKENGSMSFQTNNTNHLIIDGNGHVTKPKQPAFSVTSNQMNNLAINNTTTIQFANEIFDQNADFNHSNYTFTAPVTGKYMLNVNLRMDNVDIAHMYMYMILATSNREYEWLLDISEYQNDLDYLPFTINVLADMDASDTALVKMHIPNAGSAQSDVVGSNKTTFSGFLAC